MLHFATSARKRVNTPVAENCIMDFDFTCVGTCRSVIGRFVQFVIYQPIPGENDHWYSGVLTCTCDDIHPARAESASMAFTAADRAQRSWAKPIVTDAYFLFHLRMPTKTGTMIRRRPSFSVTAQAFSCPLVCLRQVRGTSGLSSSRMNSPGARRAA